MYEREKYERVQFKKWNTHLSLERLEVLTTKERERNDLRKVRWLWFLWNLNSAKKKCAENFQRFFNTKCMERTWYGSFMVNLWQMAEGDGLEVDECCAHLILTTKWQRHVTLHFKAYFEWGKKTVCCNTKAFIMRYELLLTHISRFLKLLHLKEYIYKTFVISK